MYYNELASRITSDNRLYRITFTDGTEENVRLYVHHDKFMGAVPCLTDNEDRQIKAIIPYPYYKLVKVASVTELAE